MKKTTILSILTVVTILLSSVTANSQRLVTSKTHFKFFSTTPAENIEANNYKAIGTLDKNTGAIIFSVPMQSFEFEKALMHEHFNSKKFLDTKTNPKSKLKGKILNLSEIDFNKEGSYPIIVEGNLTINGVTNNIKEKATLIVKDQKIELKTKFNITLADYKIAFKKGKPSTNIAKIVEVTVEAHY